MPRLTLTFNLTPYQSPLVTNNLFVQFQSDWAKTEVCIKLAMVHRRITKGNLNLWLCDQKSIGFLLSWWWTYVWSLKVTHSLSHVLTQPHTNDRIDISTPMLFRGKMSWGYYFLLLKELFLYSFDVKKTFTYTSSKIQHLYLESRKY